MFVSGGGQGLTPGAVGGAGMAPPPSGDQQAYLQYQSEQLKQLAEENARLARQQAEKRMGNSGGGGGFGMAPTTVTAGGTSFVLDPETGMMVPVGDNAQEDLVS